MKQLFRFAIIILLLVISMTTMQSCESSKDKLAATVAAISKGCPVEMPPYGSISSVGYSREDNIVTYTIDVNEQYIPMNVFSNNLDTLLIVSALRNAKVTRESSRKLLTLIDDAGASVTITYRGVSSGLSKEIHLTDSIIHADVMKSSSDIVADWGTILANSIERQRKALPMTISPDMTIEDVSSKDSTISYLVRLSPEGYEHFRENRRGPVQVKKAMIKMLHSTKTNAQFASMLRSAGFSLRYLLIKPTGEKIMEINIPCDEIK